MIYKATRDGFEYKEFHKRCDYKGKTIFILKSEFGKTFGGEAFFNRQSFPK